MNNKDIYDLELHEITQIAKPNTPIFWVMRVASGWLYSFPNGDSIFVPFDNEFMEMD